MSAVTPLKPRRAPLVLTSLTVVELTTRLEACERTIVARRRDRSALRTQLQELLLQTPSDSVSEAGGLRSQILEADEELATLTEQRSAVEGAIRAAKHRGTAAELRERKRTAVELSNQIRATLVGMQEAIDKLVSDWRSVRKLDEQFSRALPQLPAGQATMEFSRNLPEYIARRFQALVIGDGALRGTLESGTQFLQSGRGDFVQHHFALYLHNCMSAFPNQET